MKPVAQLRLANYEVFIMKTEVAPFGLSGICVSRLQNSPANRVRFFVVF